MKVFCRLSHFAMLVVIFVTGVYGLFKGVSGELMFSQMFFWVLALYADTQVLREELKETGAIKR